MADPPKFCSALAIKTVFLALVALFMSQVWISYGKLHKRSVAYDQDVISNMEQLYPSFTLCPQYSIANELEHFKDIDNGMDKIFKYRKLVLNELASLTHTVKLKDG